MGSVSKTVLVSYWRGEDQFAANRVAGLLAPIFGNDGVMLDDGALAGTEDVEALFRNVAQCAALVVIVGRGWISARGRGHRGYLTDPHDGVELAIDAALKLNKAIVPILTNGVAMPRVDELPGVIASFGMCGEIRFTREMQDLGAPGHADPSREIRGESITTVFDYLSTSRQFARESKIRNRQVRRVFSRFYSIALLGNFSQESGKHAFFALTSAAIGCGAIVAAQFADYPALSHPKRPYRAELVLSQPERRLHDRPALARAEHENGGPQFRDPPVKSLLRATSPLPKSDKGAQDSDSASLEAFSPAPAAEYRAAVLLARPQDSTLSRIETGHVGWSMEAGDLLRQDGPEVRAEIDVPKMKMRAVLTIRKNPGSSPEATYTLDLKFLFDNQADVTRFREVGLPQMRSMDMPNGDPLMGIRLKLDDDHFVFGLSRSNTSYNELLLSSRDWIDFPMLANDNSLSKLTFEKGAEGRKIIEEAMNAWR
jgi:hypothetical protein